MSATLLRGAALKLRALPFTAVVPDIRIPLAQLLEAHAEAIEEFAVLAGGERDGDPTEADAAAVVVAKAVLR